MKLLRTMALLAMAAATWSAAAEVQVIDGKKSECRDGVCMLVEEPAATNATGAAEKTGETAPRIAQGYMPAEQFVAFLEGRETASPLADAGIWTALLLALLAALAMPLKQEDA